MKSSLLMDFSVDKENHKINVKREFAASRDLVWKAWTTHEILDQWWAPKPWKSKTRTFDFRSGGHWLYAMVGPDNSEQWCRADFRDVKPKESYGVVDVFCDAEGNPTKDLPSAQWHIVFRDASDNTTLVDIEINHESLEVMEKYLEMGFREGFTAALENLDEVLRR